MSIGVVTSTNSARILPQSTKVTGSIRHSFASFSIVENFLHNGSSPAVNCSLHINSGSNFIIYSVTVTVAGQSLDFALQELNDATDIFQQSTFRSDTGFKNESSDALHLEIGDVPPNSEVSVHFECSLSAFFSTPTQFKFSVPRATENGSPNLEVSVNVFQFNPIESVLLDEPNFSFTAKSPTETEIAFTSPPHDRRRPLEFLINLANPIESTAISTLIDGQNYLGIAAIANIPSKDDLKCEFYLVIDCSGSMSGSAIATASSTLIFFLKSLPKDCLFNVVRFGSNFEVMFPTSQSFTEENQRQALDNAAKMTADMGGTDLFSPLKYILELDTVPGYSRQIFVLTDGQVDNTEIIAFATRHRKNHRIFAVGIGSKVQRTFIEDLAVSTGGESAFVASQGDEALVVTMTQLKSALRPAIVECQIHLSETETFEISPFPIPSLFHGLLYHLYIRATEVREDAGILISGSIGERQIDIPIIVNQIESGIRLDKFFAYFNIRDLEERIAIAPETEIPVLKERVVRLSMQTAIVSQFTALSAVIEGVPRVESRAAARQGGSYRPVAPEPQCPSQSMRVSQAMSLRQSRDQRSTKQRSQGYAPVASPALVWGYGSDVVDQSGGRRQGRSEGNGPMSMPPGASGGGGGPSSPPPKASKGGSGPVSPPQRRSQVESGSEPSDVDQHSNFRSTMKSGATFGGSQSLRRSAPPVLRVSAPPSPQSSATSPRSSHGGVREIISLQAFDGYWTVQLDGFDRVPWDNFAQLKGIGDSQQLELLRQTLYVLAVLEKFHNDRRIIWSIVSDKAKEWIRTQSAFPELDGLILEIRQFVS